MYHAAHCKKIVKTVKTALNINNILASALSIKHEHSCLSIYTYAIVYRNPTLN